MSDDRPEDRPVPPTGFNPEGFISYSPPFYMYILHYPKREDPSELLIGYTIDKAFFDKCLAVGMPGDAIDMKTCSALMDMRMQIVDEANQGSRKDKVLYWWVTLQGVIDRTGTGNMEATQNLDADKTLGLALAYERLLVKTIKRLVAKVPDYTESYRAAEERTQKLSEQLRAMGSQLTIEVINTMVPEEEHYTT